MFISHCHKHEDGYSNLEDSLAPMDNENKSPSSIIRHPNGLFPKKTQLSSVFSSQDIKMLADLSQQITISAENTAYLHNLVVFLRRNRFVAKGVSPVATTHLEILSRYDWLSHCCMPYPTDQASLLATVHGQSFMTPAIIGLAFPKIYHHRIKITTTESERSIQYGSHPDAIASILEGVKVDTILEDVLQELEVPV